MKILKIIILGIFVTICHTLSQTLANHENDPGGGHTQGQGCRTHVNANNGNSYPNYTLTVVTNGSQDCSIAESEVPETTINYVEKYIAGGAVKVLEIVSGPTETGSNSTSTDWSISVKYEYQYATGGVQAGYQFTQNFSVTSYYYTNTCGNNNHYDPYVGRCTGNCKTTNTGIDNDTLTLQNTSTSPLGPVCVRQPAAGVYNHACYVSFTVGFPVELPDRTDFVIIDPQWTGDFCKYDENSQEHTALKDGILGEPYDTDGDIKTDPTPEDEFNRYDTDVDGDGQLNGDASGNQIDTDIDGDGQINNSDPDIDGDGFPNYGDDDIDGDGQLNGDDPDIDNDGIPNQSDDDMDGDGQINANDPNDDGDGLLDEEDGSPGGINSGDGSGDPGTGNADDGDPNGNGDDGSGGGEGECEQDPNSPNCKDNDGQVGSQGDSSYANCEEAPICQEDDNWKCVQMQLTWENRCAIALPSDTDTSASLFTASGVDDGSEVDIEVDLTGLSFDTTGFLGSDRSCLEDVDVSILGSNYSIPFSNWCGVIAVISALVSIIGAFHSYKIVAGVF